MKQNKKIPIGSDGDFFVGFVGRLLCQHINLENCRVGGDEEVGGAKVREILYGNFLGCYDGIFCLVGICQVLGIHHGENEIEADTMDKEAVNLDPLRKIAGVAEIVILGVFGIYDVVFNACGIEFAVSYNKVPVPGGAVVSSEVNEAS